MTAVDRDSTVELARLLGVADRELLDTVGGAWRELRLEDTSLAVRVRRWFVSGEPPQILLGVRDNNIQVVIPVIDWDDHRPVLRTGPVVATVTRIPSADMNALGAAVYEAQEARRATFRYCRYCRRLTAPEDGGDTCHGCMSRYLGIVF